MAYVSGVSYIKKSSFDRPGWLSTVDAAKHFGVDRATLRRWRLDGLIKTDQLPNCKFQIVEIESIEQRILHKAICKEDPEIKVEARFWKNVEKRGPNECWPWIGLRSKDGYGRMKGAGRGNEFSHRVAWRLVNGPIPVGLFICHRCDNPPCCNEAHLYAGTNRMNMKDMRERGRSAVGPKNGTFTRPERRPRGERQGSAKLTDAKVRLIRELYSRCDGTTQKDLGRRFGVEQTVISAVTRRKSWSHVK